MARINTLSVQRRAVTFTELATVLLATEDRVGMTAFNASLVKDMQDAFSDLAEAMGFDLVAIAPPRARSALSTQTLQAAE